MDLIRHRGPDGLWHAVNGNVGMGSAMFATRTIDAQYRQPVSTPDDSLTIVADARLYNRDELQHRLGSITWLPEVPSDAGIILAAYEYWGVRMLDVLDGDFVFAIWDAEHQQIIAARDPFGVKPFFYYQDSQRFVFGSEPKQLLVMPGVPVEPDDVTIGEFLLWKFKDSERTFFKGIRRLKPAHFLVATMDSAVQSRWWNPDPRDEITYRNPQRYYDQFRELLKSAVAKRLNTDFPVGAHLSGGFDSSSIVVLAAEIYRDGNDVLPPLETISAIYENLPCDESRYIQAVTKQVSFPSNTFNPLDHEVLLENSSEAIWQRDSPFARIHPAFSNGCNRIMSKIGARVQLDGTGGDPLAQFYYDMSDHLRAGRLIPLIRESWAISRPSINKFLGQIYRASRSVVPEAIKRPYRQVRTPRKITMAGWLTPEFADYLKQQPSAPVLYAPEFGSYGQNATLGLLSHPTLYWAIETLELEGCYNGYEARLPYCDRPLVDFVLAIPLKQRLKGEQWRYLQRRGLADCLPATIVERDDQTYFDLYFMQALADIRPQLDPMLFSSAIWHSSPYICKEQAEKLYHHFSPEDTEYYSLHGHALWSIAALEIWLRQLPRYSQNKIMKEHFSVITSEI